MNGVLGKLACELDRSASTVFFLRSPKITRRTVSHKTKALKEEINNQTFLERAMLPEFTLLMLYNAFFLDKPSKNTADCFVVCLFVSVINAKCIASILCIRRVHYGNIKMCRVLYP